MKKLLFVSLLAAFLITGDFIALPLDLPYEI